MHANAGLLIVNADDWGGDSSATDAILATFESGGITSTTGFVHMPDSHRAAEIALGHGIPVGLHLNLTAAFIDPDLAPPVRDRQARLVQLLAGEHAHKAWHPRALRLVRRAVEDQLAEFERLYGGPPTHIDGHQHVHLSPTVVLSWKAPRRLPQRRTVNWPPAAGPAARTKRALRDLSTARLNTPDWLASIRTVHPAFGGSGIDDLLARSATASVEIMVHPQWRDEFQLLTSPGWLAELRGHPLGSFADLRS